eukprot:278177_1
MSFTKRIMCKLSKQLSYSQSYHHQSSLLHGPILSHFFSSSANDKTNSSVQITFITQDGINMSTTARIGQTILDVCLDNELDVEGACGGECCCSTCHVYLPQDLFDSLEEPDEDELDMLDLAIAVKDISRLGCQITVDQSFDGKIIQLPSEVVNHLPE